MKHNLEISFTTHYPWIIEASINGSSLEVSNQQLTGTFELLDSNCLEIKFLGKDATVNPDMTLQINHLIFDYLDLTPVLYSATHYTDHLDYPEITPCTDINLNGVWRLRFDRNIVRHTLVKYLGTNNE